MLQSSWAGAGIVILHVTGMTALHTDAMMHDGPVYVVVSLAIGVIASGLLHFAHYGSMKLRLATASIALELAIAHMMLVFPAVLSKLREEMHQVLSA